MDDKNDWGSRIPRDLTSPLRPTSSLRRNENIKQSHDRKPFKVISESHKNESLEARPDKQN